MYYNGFLKVALVTPPIEVGSPIVNAKKIVEQLNELKTAIALFPELVLSGYTAQDLFFRQDFLAENLQALKYIIENTTYEGIFVIGLPLNISGITYNVAAVCSNKKVLGIIPKYYLPNYREFSEKRW